MNNKALQKNKWFITLLSVLLASITFLGLMFGTQSINRASAEEVLLDTTETDFVPTARETLNNTWFAGFNKCENETVGRALFANYFINDGYYSPDNYNYGVLIFPQAYYENFIHNDDYVREFTEQGKQYLDVQGNGHYDVTGGTLLRYGIANIKDQNISLQFCFVFYAQDKVTEEYTYFTRKYASYPTLSQDGEVDLSQYRTNEEYFTLKSKMQAKIDELTAAINEDGSIDLSQFVSKSSHDREVAELQEQIDTLTAENTQLKSVEEKTGLTFMQIIGITAGAIILIAVICGAVSIFKKKKDDYYRW